MADNKLTEMRTFAANASGLVRHETLDGADYLVVPAILITHGVHNGIYYPTEELSEFAQAWNGVPVPVYHPTINGVAVSANEPLIIENRCVGSVFNVRFEDDKLKGEVWVNIAKANKVDKRIVPMIEKEQRMELSTGMYQKEIQVNGEWNGEKYIAVASGIRPDHLALLPDQKGACSWEDGGGMPRLNADTNDSFIATLVDKIIQAFSVSKATVTVETGNTDNLQAGSEPSIQNQDTIETNKGENEMEREPVIAALLASGAWTEDDREFLATLAQDKFDKLAKMQETPAVNESDAAVEQTPERKADEAPVVNEEPVKVDKAPVTLEAFVESAPAEFKDTIKAGLALFKAKRDAIIANVAKSEVFTAEDLKDKSMAELEKLNALAEKAVTANADFSGRGTAVQSKPEVTATSATMPIAMIDWTK
jgi:hypothetical protein